MKFREEDLKMFRKKISLITCSVFVFVYLVSSPIFAKDSSSQKEEVLCEKSFKNVLNINMAAAVALGITFQRLHIPVNYEKVVKSDMSIVIGIHPAIPLNSNSSGEAFGTSVRIRHYGTLRAPRGFWREWGIWGIFQREKSSKENQSKLRKTYGDSMAGVLFDVGYKYIIPNSHIIIEPFVGIAQPVLKVSKEKTKLFGLPFPWAGLSVGFAF
jgi:hypothetical protein